MLGQECGFAHCTSHYNWLFHWFRLSEQLVVRDYTPGCSTVQNKLISSVEEFTPIPDTAPKNALPPTDTASNTLSGTSVSSFVMKTPKVTPPADPASPVSLPVRRRSGRLFFLFSSPELSPCV